jgi:methyltransferase (TIGR00027 family)
MREGRPSLTASIVALGRALYEEAPEGFAPTRDGHADELLPMGMRALAKLARPLWSVSPALARQAFRAVTFGLSEHVALRTRAIDECIERAIREGVRQMVTLGAGLDTRAWRMEPLASVRVFEVDHPATQQFKTRRVDRARSLAKELRFVTVDFNRDSLDERLSEAGHDRGEPTIWVLEGVSVYLKRAALEATIEALSARSEEGSALAFTYVPKAVLTRWSKGQRSIEAVASAIGERFEGLIEKDEARALIEARGWAIERDEGTRELAERWMSGVDAESVWERERVLTARFSPRRDRGR